MKVISGVNKKKALERETVVTIGAFDGLHLGHRKIIDEVARTARRRRLRSVVVTFAPHPSKILSDNPEPLLLSLRKKLDIFRISGIDTCLIIRFNRRFSTLSPEDFVRRVLVDYLKAQVVIVGFDYVFGKSRKGNGESLSELGRKYGFQVLQIGAVRKGGEIVSSTRIRELIRQGNIAQANFLLGRMYEITGAVVKGEKRGKFTGYPTANLGNIDVLLPAPGVYAGQAIFGGHRFKAALNLGWRPTFSSVRARLRRRKKPVAEVHLLRFKSETYGKKLSFCFMHRIRDEIAFHSVGELRRQIQSDLKKIARA